MKKQKKLGIMAQLVMLCVLPMVIMVSCITVYAISTMRSMVRATTMEGLENLCQSVFSAYEALDSGAYRMEGDILYKGDYNVSENVDIIDSFVKGSNADVTIFYGDTRRATSLRDKDTGERILGTKASDEVIQTVLNGGKTYETDSVVINGETYYSFYMPALDAGGNCVGMVFAGQPATEATAQINRSSLMILGISLLILFIALLVCLKIASAIARVVVQTEGLLSSLAEGDLNLSVNERIL
ncbi:MAG: cache domain-containing protein, partial [Lachnospiraceae bacterium]|nr:cache domain-containing protein [Lachnospiraceae bacterium]